MSEIPQVPVSDPGFRHGVGVFETVRVKGGRARWRDWHLESIRASASVLGLRVEEGELRRIPPGEGLWRWFVTGSGMRTWWSPGLERVPESFSLEPSEVGVWSTAWEARHKTLSYLSRVQARRGVEGKDAEVVLVNERGEIASASMANLFWVKRGILRTPARDCGCRGGTVRRWVLERSGYAVEEGKWGLAELDGAEEIFLTNARIGIARVDAWKKRKIGDGKISEVLAKRFWAEEDGIEAGRGVA